MTRTSPTATEMLSLAARDTLHKLATSTGWEKVSLAEGQFHTGDAPRLVDQEAQTAFETSIHRLTGPVAESVIAIVGEEAIRRVPREPEPGARVIVLDPLDGSSQWARISTAYAVATYCLVGDESRRWRLEAVVVANPSHLYSWSAGRPGFTFGAMHSEYTVNVLSPVPDDPWATPSIAFTGFKAKDRAALVAVATALPQWDIFTVGGNPVTPYVATAQLTVALTLRPQTTWDALGVFLLSQAEAYIGDLEGTRLSGETFGSMFETVLLEGNVRRIPALIAAKSEKRYTEVVGALEPHVDQGNVLSPPIESLDG